MKTIILMELIQIKFGLEETLGGVLFLHAGHVESVDEFISLRL